MKLQSEGVVCFHGNGKQIREFINSDDVADASLYFLNTNNNEGLVNIGNDEYFEIDKIVQKITEFLPSSNKYVWEDSDTENKEKPYLVSKDRMRKLGWNPKIDLDSGLSSFHFWLTNDVK
jgi:GDP-L-fucose synthase